MAKTRMIEAEGFVLRVSSYKENDAMVTILTKEGLVSFLARGIFKPTSKNRAAAQLLGLARFSLNESAAGSYSLAESVPLASPDGKEDLPTLAALSFLAELCSKTVQNEEAPEVYPWLAKTLQAMADGFDPLTAALIFFARLLVIEGYGLNVDSCVYCGGKTGIVGVSYADGGFVCQNDLAGDAQKASARKLRILRFIFRCGLEDLGRVSFGKDETKEIFGDLGRYLSDLTGVALRSLSILEKA
jgi:DNA repair protein RecO (recombination protein O)